MASQPYGSLLRYLRRTASAGQADRLSDGQLLERFVASQDASAFEALVQRHGPLVWGVCKRVAWNQADAEDAFQATFLVLTRKAGALEKRASLGSWLHGVAYRVTLRANANLARRRNREQQAANMNPITTPTDDDWDELRPLLDAELSRLPEKLRVPLVLCYLEGKTNEQAARELGWPVGSISKRLARGREVLRERLAGRGAVFASALLGTTLTQHAASAAVPAPLVDLTTSLAQALAAGQGTALASTSVTALTEGALRAMWIAKLKVMCAVTAGCLALVAGSALLAQQVLPPASQDAPAQQSRPLMSPAEFAALQQLMKPGPEDSRWMTVPWLPSNNIWAARQLAAKEGKPLFLWYMAGEPLGQC